jgi:hypothetical protein
VAGVGRVVAGAPTPRRWPPSPTATRPSTSKFRPAIPNGSSRDFATTGRSSSATVAYGDKAIGVNHVLPTAGAARYTGGLWVGKFLKTVTYQRVSAEGTRQVAPATTAICEAELMLGHALTASERLAAVERPGRS